MCFPHIIIDTTLQYGELKAAPRALESSYEQVQRGTPASTTLALRRLHMNSHSDLQDSMLDNCLKEETVRINDNGQAIELDGIPEAFELGVHQPQDTNNKASRLCSDTRFLATKSPKLVGSFLRSSLDKEKLHQTILRIDTKQGVKTKLADNIN